MNTIPIEAHDSKLPHIYPFTGKLSNNVYEKLCRLLCDCFDNSFDDLQYSDNIIYLKFLRSEMAKEKLAVITKNTKVLPLLNYVDIVKKNTYVDKSKRLCYRKTFGNLMVNKISNLILNEIKNRVATLDIIPLDIRFDSSHGDILLYKGGGFFEKHRDGINSLPASANYDTRWRMYSLLIGIDSNIDHIQMDNGSTEVFLPSLSWLFKNNKKTSSLHKQIYRHVYPESFIPLHYVIFPAEARHSSIKLLDEQFKLTLKLDLWLKIAVVDKKNINKICELSFMNYCKCKLCNIKTYTTKQYINKIKNTFILPNVIINIIVDYIVDNIKRNECIHSTLKCPCICNSCNSCLSCYKPVFNYYKYDDDDDDYNGFCNGYDD
jgi:hypothetical protein